MYDTTERPRCIVAKVTKIYKLFCYIATKDYNL